jgi:DNA repair protein RadA/Sms
LEGEREQGLRTLRSSKHRFGSTSEIGLMTLGQTGLKGVDDASGLFLADRLPLTTGSVVSATIQGNRSLAIEVQALVVPSVHPQPKRSAKGLDSGRMGLLLAVMEQHCRLRFGREDVYANIAGGVKVGEPGVDLAVCVALASALHGWPIPEGWFVAGEVGLGGEIRGVTRLDQRLSEAARLGFDSAMVPASGPSSHDDLAVYRVGSLPEALSVFMLDNRAA